MLFFKRKNKQEKNPLIEREHLEIVMTTFSNNNFFFKLVRDLVVVYPGASSLHTWLKELENNHSFLKEFELHSTSTTKEKFVLKKDTANYLKLIMQLHGLLIKCNTILWTSPESNQQYLASELYDTAFLLIELERSLKSGVPLTDPIVKDSIETLSINLTEVLKRYYALNTEKLEIETQINKKIHKKYAQDRNELLKQISI